MTSSRARGQQGWAIRDVMMAMFAACLASTGIDSATVSAKTRLTLYHVGWCGSICDDPLEAVETIKSEIKQMGVDDLFEAVTVDCSSAFQSPECCRHGVKSYPSVHVTPKGSNKFWVFQGERNYDQMRYALLEDKSIKVLVPEQGYSGLRCAIKAIKLSTGHYLTRTIIGSAVLGSVIGGLIVYLYVAMKYIKFGSKRSDWGWLVATIIVTYYVFV